MAEFPYPEYRNLWRGSKLSKDDSALGGTANGGSSRQTSEGKEWTAGPVTDGAQSYIYTNSAFRVPVESNAPYSWAIPVKNTGDVSIPCKFYSWLERSTSGNVAKIDRFVLNPGETRVVKLENLVSEDAHDIRFSMYYNAGDDKPPEGSKITILNGITLVQSETAPPFPFNGDGAKPAETLLRRNLLTNPSFEEGLAGWAIQTGTAVTASSHITRMWGGGGSGSSYLEAKSSGTDPYTIAYRRDLVTASPGQWVASACLLASEQTGRPRLRQDLTVRDADGVETNITNLDAYDSAIFYAGTRRVVSTQMPSGTVSVAPRVVMYSGAGDMNLAEGARLWADSFILAVADSKSEAEAAVATYFDGDTPPSGNIVRRWAPDGTSLEVETIQPPTGRTYVWDGEPYKSTSTLWVGDSAHATGVMEISASTDARLGIVADVYSRSREKIALELARVDSQLIAGERVELDAAAMTASPVVWHWRQITGPAVELEPREASMDFIAPDVDEETPLRIAVYAASEDGRNRSDWHYFDLTIKPPIARFRATEGAFSPVSPKYVGYDRGKREVWNDVIPPSGFSPSPRHEVEILDLGIVPDDVQFTTGEPPEVAAAGGIYVDLETGDIYRNFGAGYNETDDTTAAPRTNAWWVNPATGDILEWIED